jgi:outer membrane protein assembly factor BamA
VESPRILENVYPIVDGQIIPQIIGQRERTEDGFSFNFAEGSAALVYDNALFGFTSPFAGQRYRFELNPMVGQIQMTNALADYRRYVWLRPFTVAARGYHLGRYGRDAEGLFRDLILGQEWSQWRVRGYSPGDVVNECRQQPGTGCPVLEEMQGSRLAMGSAELRFPLIRQVVVGAGLGLPPIEGFLFGDGGVAWRDGVSPTFSRGRQADEGRHGLYTSIGAGARINVFGLLILEAAYVNPLDRPRGWHWQFAMQPGF